jgi:hypothetical protein
MSNIPPSLRSETVTICGLTDRQAAFVREYIARAGKRGAATAAVLAAGITQNRAAARVRASEFLRDPTVLQLLRDELTRKLNAGAVLGVNVLEDLAMNAKSEQVRLGAARELLDRGYGPIVSRNATVVAKTSIEDLLARIDAQDAADRQGPLIDVSPTDSVTEIDGESLD